MYCTHVGLFAVDAYRNYNVIIRDKRLFSGEIRIAMIFREGSHRGTVQNDRREGFVIL